MNNIEQRIERMITYMTPNDFEKIENELKPRKSFWTILKPAFAVAFALVMGITSWGVVSNNNKLLGTIGIDVNPSLELQINKKEKVMQVITNNQDAADLVGNMDLEGSSLDVAINAIIGAMYQQGYLNENANSVLVSFTNDKLEQLAVNSVSASLNSEKITVSVISQKVEENKELEQLANDNNISVNKASLIETIVEADNNIHTVEEFKDLSINELNLLASAKQAQDVTISGNASQNEYIGTSKATEIALAKYNLTSNDITNLTIEIDYEHGQMIYEVEFNANNKEYDVEVDALTGNILSAEYDIEDEQIIVTEEVKISAVQAKEIALNDAQVTNYTDYEINLENGVYDVDFEANGYEYEYKINANSGVIINKLKEKDDDHTNVSKVNISAIKAKEIALNDAQVTNYTDYDIELENNNYEVEFEVNGVEYEYVISASDGSIIYKNDNNQATENVISLAKVKEIVLQDAQVSVVTNYEVELKNNLYEVEFEVNGVEYEYLLSALTGEIIDKKNEIIPSMTNISASQAKGIALDNANAVDYSDLTIELDDGVYEIEFKVGTTEYEYKISASTGKILNKKSESNESVTGISAAKAKEVALQDAGLTTVTEFDIELNHEIYEIEFKANGYEYEYEIKAVDGSIIKKDKELDD